MRKGLIIHRKSGMVCRKGGDNSMDNLTLRQWRVLKGLTQKDVADALGTHQTVYARWEKDPYGKLSLDKADKLSKLFGMSREQLFPMK